MVKKEAWKDKKIKEVLNKKNPSEEEIAFTKTLQQMEYKKRMQMLIAKFTDKKDLADQFWYIQPFRYDKNKIWWKWEWKHYRWDQIDDTDILNDISRTSIANTINSKEKNEILEALKQYGRLINPKEIKKTWVQFDKIIVDIKTGEKFEANPQYFITNPIPYEIGRSEKTPIMDKIFKEWVGEDYAQTLYEIIAYCCLPDYPIHRLFCLVGPGSNGKSCFQRLIIKFIGTQNITSTELDDLLSSRFERAKLYKKMVCLMGETNFNTISKTSLIKRLTGQDTISFEFKTKTPFDDFNYAKILISTNGLPYSEDKTIGFYRRWCIVDFPNVFSEEKDILKDIPEEEYNNLANKCIKILKELLKKRKFTNEGSIEQRREKYEELSNPVDKFIDEECVKKFDVEIPFFKFYEELLKFIESRNYRKLSKPEVSRILQRDGFEIKTAKRYKGDGSETTWKIIQGLILKYEEIKPRFEIMKDISNLVLEGLENKDVGEIIVWTKELNNALEILEKDGYIKKIGSEV